MRETLCALLLVAAAVGFAACDDGGNPTGPTPVVPPVVGMQADERAALQSVEAWLSLLDAGNYSAAYDATGSYFRENVTAEEFGPAWKNGSPCWARSSPVR